MTSLNPMVEQLTPSAMKRQTPVDWQEKLARILRTPGAGAALHTDGRQGGKVLISYGTRESDLPGLRPSRLDDLQLTGFCPPKPIEASMVSPLLRNREELPQINLPPRGPATTIWPDGR